ncbi:MAG TPA: hypothetical protein VFA14_04815 [Herbaspirillum sp.]|nr:hypothetical protein [Herbaspirillum sp.]
MDRIEEAIKADTPMEKVFPRLMTLATNVEGEGPTIRVRITRNEDASAIRYVSGDDPEGADPEGRQQDETRLQEGLVSDRPLVNIEPIHIRQYLD